MSFIDELKRLARPYEDEDEDQFEDDFTPVSSREPVREPERRNNKVVNITPPLSFRSCWSSQSGLKTPLRSPTISGTSAL